MYGPPFAELYHYESISRGLDDQGEKAERYNKESEHFREKWKAELEAYKESLSANDLYAEFADKVALAKDARIVTNGNYVAIVIAGIANPDYAPIDTALETALNF